MATSSRDVFLLFLLFSAASPPFLFVESADVNTINNAFPFNGFSYEIAGNSEACGNIVEDLRYDSNVSNYDLNISTTLKKLSKKGGWLKIHPGIYNLTTSISIPSRVCFAGTHPDKVVLDAKIPVANGFSAINLKGVTRSTLVNFTLKTNATNGIYISYSSYVFVKSVDATGVAGSNLYVNGGHHHAIYGGSFQNCKSDCVSIVNSHHVSVGRSVISGCGKHGIRVGGSSYIRLAACRVSFGEKASNSSCAISTGAQGETNSSAVLVTGNDLHDAPRGGVCGGRTRTLIIEDNNFISNYWNTSDCIVVDDLINELDLLHNYCDNGGFSSF